MRVISLSSISFEKIVEAHNYCFEHYYIPMRASADQLYAHWIGRGLDLNLSVGTLQYGKLIGFLAIGVGERNGQLWAHNLSTGVVPSARGQGLVDLMMKKVVTQLHQNGCKKITTELIHENRRALQVYYRCGFAIDRELLSFSGAITQFTNCQQHEYNIQVVSQLPLINKSDFFDFEPSWENDINSIRTSAPWMKYLIIQIPPAKTILGIASFNPYTHQLHCLAIHKKHRGKGLSKALLQAIAKESPRIKITHIDTNSPIVSYLEKIGAFPYLRQFELSKSLN